MHLPTELEIAAKIRELPVPGDMPMEQVRVEAVKAILAERAPAPQRPSGTVLSRSTVAIADGHLEITVTHYPSEGTAPA